MKLPYRFTLDIQLFADEPGAVEPGVEGAPVAGEPPQGVEEPADQSGVDEQAAAEPDKQNNYEKAFAKRLAAEREKWEADRQTELDKYKDHDAYKKAAEYLQRTTGINDILTLKEEIELAELQDRADKENVPASVIKRIDELEAKAARVDEIDASAKQQAEWQAFESSLKDFCTDKTIDGNPVDHMELWKYMHEHEIVKPEVAFKAMKADVLEPKLETAKTDAVNEYLKSKSAPKTGGGQGAAATTYDKPASSWKEAEQRAVERMRASRNAQ